MRGIFREFQFSWMIAGILVPIQILITIVFVSKAGNNPIPLGTYLWLTGMFVLVALLFYSMTTKVDDQFIVISFGIGLVRKKIALRRIKNVRPVTIPWYYGYGIRMIPNGWLYNVSGRHGVELEFADKKRIVRIGTKDSSALVKAIDSRRNQ